MPDDLEFIARLLAFGTGRAMPLASHRRVAIQPEALVVCPLAMAGADGALHAVALGRLGAGAELRAVPDPRVHADQGALAAWLGARLEAYCTARWAAGSYPQTWVASAAAARQLEVVADRWRFNGGQPGVRRAGQLLAYLTGRLPVAGQQTLLTATGALQAHLATGQAPAEDEHLGALLAWVRGPGPRDIHAAVARATRQPMGVTTDPRFDRETLAPLLRAYAAARGRGAAAPGVRRQATAIAAALRPVLLPIYGGVQDAVQALEALALPLLPALPGLEQREAEAFAAFMAGHAGMAEARRRIFEVVAWEAAQEHLEAVVRYGDAVGRARSRRAGEIVTGIVQNPQRLRRGPRRVARRFEVVSRQPILRLRLRDELRLLRDPRLVAVVTAIRRQGGTAHVALEVCHGMRRPGLPPAGAQVDLGPKLPDWEQPGRQRRWLTARLARPSWTQGTGPAPRPAPRPSPPPPDLLASLEAER